MARDIGNSLQVAPGTSMATYAMVLSDFAFATGAYDVANIGNPSASTTAMVVTNIYAAMDATAAATFDIYLSRRTAANTGGTAVLLTQANFGASQAVGSGLGVVSARDSNDQACNAVANVYTANPSAYGTGYFIDAGHLTAPAASSPGVPLMAWNPVYANRAAKPPIIRPGQYLGIGVNGQSAPSGISAYILVEWVEVPLMSLF